VVPEQFHLREEARRWRLRDVPRDEDRQRRQSDGTHGGDDQESNFPTKTLADPRVEGNANHHRDRQPAYHDSDGRTGLFLWNYRRNESSSDPEENAVGDRHHDA
jgi:hypothetical protein